MTTEVEQLDLPVKRSGVNPPHAPEISVGMPVYNGERYLGRAIESILEQSFTDFELIISDNASVDATQQISEDFARLDTRIRYIRQDTNLGGPRNWNYVARCARGKLFKWAAANDLCDREMFAKCKEILDQRPEIVLCYPRAKLIDENGQVLGEYEDGLDVQDAKPSDRFIKLLRMIGLNNAQSGLIRSAVLRNTALEGIYQQGDINLLAELSLYGKFYEVPEYLFYRRISSDASTTNKSWQELLHFNAPTSQRWYLPIWRFNLGFIGRIHRSPINLKEKLRLYYFILKMLYWNKSLLIQELVTARHRRAGDSI